MVYEDVEVCVSDPLPDAIVSLPNMHGEVTPDRACDCRLDGERVPLCTTPGEVTVVANSSASDPEEREEATPLVLDDGSPPSIAAKAALFEVPPLLEVSPKRAVPALSSVDISPFGETQTTTLFFSFTAFRSRSKVRLITCEIPDFFWRLLGSFTPVYVTFLEDASLPLQPRPTTRATATLGFM